MFRQSYNPFARLDLPFRMPKEVSPRVRRNRKSLAHGTTLGPQLGVTRPKAPFEELPFGLQHQSKDEEGVAINNNSLNNCTPTICAPQDDCDLLELDYPDSPMTHPPRTVIVRTGGLKPRKKNSVHRKRLFSIDFSTICNERGEETSLDEDDLYDTAMFSTYPLTATMLVLIILMLSYRHIHLSPSLARADLS